MVTEIRNGFAAEITILAPWNFGKNSGCPKVKGNRNPKLFF